MSRLLIILVFLTPFVGSSQESIIKDFAEGRSNYKLCLYPSTLRMMNINKDPEFNELVNDVEKLLVYTLDSATSASQIHSNWTKEYRDIGYEEYITMYGAMNLVILGKNDEYVGVTGTRGNVAAFYLRGGIALEKIPQLVQTFESGDIFNLITDQITR